MKKKPAKKAAAAKKPAKPAKKKLAPHRPSEPAHPHPHPHPHARPISAKTKLRLAAGAAAALVVAAVWRIFSPTAPAPRTVDVGPGDTSASLAQRYLGDASSAWMIEDFNGAARVVPGGRVVIPAGPWNLSGVFPDGYQVVPILVYHNLAKRAGGRLVLAASKFAEQMRLLKTGGYRVVSLRDFTAWTRLQKQLPRNAVVLTFDDGYRSFLTYAYPVLKEYGFTATLFVPSAFVGAGRAALTWDELKSLASEGFDVEAHSKVHDYLLRKAKESDAAYAKRMAAEIDEPRDAFALHLGSAPALIAYPYGSADDAVLAKVRGAGYAEGFTVKRLSSPSFVDPFLIPRRQVYSEMSLKDFEKNLETFHAEKLSNPAAPTPRARDLAALVLNPADPAAFADLREAAKPAFIPPPPVLAPARSRANGAEPAAEAEPRIERAAPAAAAAPGPGAEAAPTAPPPEVSSGAAPAPPDR